MVDFSGAVFVSSNQNRVFADDMLFIVTVFSRFASTNRNRVFAKKLTVQLADFCETDLNEIWAQNNDKNSFLRSPTLSPQLSTTESRVKSENSQELTKMLTETAIIWLTAGAGYDLVDCVEENNMAGGDSDAAIYRTQNQPKIPRRPTHGNHYNFRAFHFLSHECSNQFSTLIPAGRAWSMHGNT